MVWYACSVSVRGRGSSPLPDLLQRGKLVLHILVEAIRLRCRHKWFPCSVLTTVLCKLAPPEFLQKAEKLIQASEDGSSSHASSLRTEKSLQRQREWEIDHARVRARRLREERLQEYQQETKVGSTVQRCVAVLCRISLRHE